MQILGITMLNQILGKKKQCIDIHHDNIDPAQD